LHATAAVTAQGASKEIPQPFFTSIPFNMTRHPDIPEMLDQYMEVSGRSDQWITVKDLRTFFQLDDSASPPISEFFAG
jgi:hypothetical protein